MTSRNFNLQFLSYMFEIGLPLGNFPLSSTTSNLRLSGQLVNTSCVLLISNLNEDVSILVNKFSSTCKIRVEKDFEMKLLHYSSFSKNCSLTILIPTLLIILFVLMLMRYEVSSVLWICWGEKASWSFHRLLLKMYLFIQYCNPSSW